MKASIYEPEVLPFCFLCGVTHDRMTRCVRDFVGEEVVYICSSCVNQMYQIIKSIEDPLAETSRSKTFYDVFNGLSGEDKNDVEEKNFINELMKTGIFTKEQCKEAIRKAMSNGQIYERRAGVYSKA